MYYYINGTLAFVQPDTAVIDCGGVGYKCTITSNTYKDIASLEKVKLYTYLNVKEDALDLYGFANEQEKLFFTLLISISGVGPKAATAILSELRPDEFASCVMTSNVKAITKAQGIGTKTAQRICLELKDKIAKTKIDTGTFEDSTDFTYTDNISDAISVLVGFGYSKNDATQAVNRCPATETSDIVKQALRLLSKNL